MIYTLFPHMQTAVFPMKRLISPQTALYYIGLWTTKTKIVQLRCRLDHSSVLISHDLSRLVGKPTICIGENKDADQLRGNREADQRLCFRYSDSTIPLLLKSKNFKLLALFCACTGRFVSDLFRNHMVGFSTRRLIYFDLQEHLSRIQDFSTGIEITLSKQNKCPA